MATRMIENQRKAFLARSMDAARRLQDELVNLSDAQRAAILAVIAAKTSTPVDITLLGEPGDWRDAHEAAHGLRTTHDHRWELGSGCYFVVDELPR